MGVTEREIAFAGLIVSTLAAIGPLSVFLWRGIRSLIVVDPGRAVRLVEEWTDAETRASQARKDMDRVPGVQLSAAKKSLTDFRARALGRLHGFDARLELDRVITKDCKALIVYGLMLYVAVVVGVAWGSDISGYPIVLTVVAAVACIVAFTSCYVIAFLGVADRMRVILPERYARSLIRKVDRG